jgi:hypothetical protein
MLCVLEEKLQHPPGVVLHPQNLLLHRLDGRKKSCKPRDFSTQQATASSPPVKPPSTPARATPSRLAAPVEGPSAAPRPPPATTPPPSPTGAPATSPPAAGPAPRSRTRTAASSLGTPHPPAATPSRPKSVRAQAVTLAPRLPVRMQHTKASTHNGKHRTLRILWTTENRTAYRGARTWESYCS